MVNKKVLIGMSGGVDSSVAAYLMLQNGFSCIGTTMSLCDGLPDVSAMDSRDAATVAKRLGIPFYTMDACDAFRKEVVDPFVQAYEEGLTPNPCILCNRHLKFRTMLHKALELGCDGVATGHYAIIKKDESTGRYLLYKAADKQKDQSYFLACLDQEQLSRTHLPLGSFTKDEIREIAEKQGFITARKKDSQDICFIPDGDYVSFIQKYTGKTYPQGAYLDLEGKVVGQHQGAISYTIGQRRGLGIAMGKPVYVCSKDMQTNSVTVGPDEALFHTTLLAKSWNWIAIPDLTAPMEVDAKVRYRHQPQKATVYPEEDGVCRVVFQKPQRAITPGQAVVLYQGDLVVGSGTICEVP